MLELNKEYTYSQICEELGWKTSTGNSKKAQIKEIELAFERRATAIPLALDGGLR